MGPGGVPVTRAEAVKLALEIRARNSTALDPYLARAGEAQLAARDDGDVMERIAEQLGVDPEELSQHIDIEGSLHVSAVVELLVDLMHACAEHNLVWSNCIQEAAAQWRNQSSKLQRFLIYGASDDVGARGQSNYYIHGTDG